MASGTYVDNNGIVITFNQNGFTLYHPDFGYKTITFPEWASLNLDPDASPIGERPFHYYSVDAPIIRSANMCEPDSAWDGQPPFWSPPAIGTFPPDRMAAATGASA